MFIAPNSCEQSRPARGAYSVGPPVDVRVKAAGHCQRIHDGRAGNLKCIRPAAIKTNNEQLFASISGFCTFIWTWELVLLTTEQS